jgi:NFU1 iron-sulfur cluster scaffold homolog, mitochondrial
MIKVTHTEATPNPSALKYVTDTPLVGSGALSFGNAEEAEQLPLAKTLFALEGIEAVYLQENFVTVKAQSGSDWSEIKATVAKALEAFEPVAAAPPKSAPAEGDDILGKVNATIDKFVRPALAGDGGGLEVLGMEGATVFIRYQGACGGCPSAVTGTLFAIENLLKDQVDEAITVQAM